MRHHCSISNARSSAQIQTCVRRRWRSRCQKIRWSVRGPVDTCDNVLKKVPFSEFRGYSYLARPSRARLTRRSGLTVRLTAVRACAARVRDVPPSRGPPGRPWSAWLRSDGPLPDARGAAGRRRGRVGPRTTTTGQGPDPPDTALAADRRHRACGPAPAARPAAARHSHRFLHSARAAVSTLTGTREATFSTSALRINGDHSLQASMSHTWTCITHIITVRSSYGPVTAFSSSREYAASPQSATRYSRRPSRRNVVLAAR